MSDDAPKVGADDAPEPRPALAAAVHVRHPVTFENLVYLPGECPPPEVAARITNPDAWVDGLRPTAAVVGDPATKGPETPDGPEDPDDPGDPGPDSPEDPDPESGPDDDEPKPPTRRKRASS